MPIGAKTCWVCGGALEPFAYRVHAWTKRTRPSWTGFALICPGCYDQPRQNDDRHEWSDGRELLGVQPSRCENCGLRVVRKPDKRNLWHTCSEACRVALYRAVGKRMEERRGIELPTCQGCGAEMDGRSDQRYCASACRQRAYRQRRRGA